MRRSTRGSLGDWSATLPSSMSPHKPKTIAHMANPVFEAVRTVLAIRDFDGKEIPDDVVRRIAESAHLTASASNRQPWHFVVVREQEGLRKLGALVRTGPYTAKAAAAVIVAYEKESGQYGLSDAIPPIQSIILTASVGGTGC